ncbi:asparagine synthetase A [Micromonospora rifamycinica]|uniref:Aspartate-ammonia ligase n=1 Tax=Micromonospora rifamycinica TaxID=291594 RepID=A0A125Q259_9ACTN|nr:asparagine synthetase A [Micromonospora rifamycinica]KWV34295.1 asparagine ligase [Micromonospora rifamycinica]SCG34726.1 aspartate-ammonia ligase [Micromonospora rifamycinica]
MTASIDTAVRPDLRAHLTADSTRAALRIQQCVLVAVRHHLDGQGFAEVLPPIIGPVTDPGIRGSKQVDIDYYGERYRLMTSAILYKQASLLSFDKIYCIAPNVRLEPLETAETSRHLAEFHQIDVELAHAGRAEAMSVAHGIFRAALQAVIERCPGELTILGRDPAALSGALGEVGTMTHDDATARLREAGQPQDPYTEINWQAERTLSAGADTPFFIVDYPKGSRGFYDQEDPDRPGVLRNFDLIAPEGYGELASGGQREHDYAKLVTRMRETGENPAKYSWYLALARQGLPPSAGFGIGLERLIRYVTGLDAVWQVCAFPKIPGVVSP